MSGKVKVLTEETKLKINFGLIIATASSVLSIGIWVGNVDKSVANVEQKVQNTEINARTLNEINVRLSRIEGILEEMRRK